MGCTPSYPARFALLIVDTLYIVGQQGVGARCVMASTASVCRELSWRRSMRIRPSPKHCSRRRQSSSRPSATMPPPAPGPHARFTLGSDFESIIKLRQAW